MQLFGANVGLNALVGPARRLDTVGGFTAWKYLAFVSLIGAVWGLLTGTRLLRGEEDAGRWELLLAGDTTRRRAAAQALAGLGRRRPLPVGRDRGHPRRRRAVGERRHRRRSAAYSSPSRWSSSGVVFLAVGRARRPARRDRPPGGRLRRPRSLGASYALRLVADSGVGVDWLRWASPLGWVEELRPLTAPRPLALLPVAATVAALCAA